MPETFEGPEFSGYVSEEAASLTGLKAGTPVAAGGGDQAAQVLRLGEIRQVRLRWLPIVRLTRFIGSCIRR